MIDPRKKFFDSSESLLQNIQEIGQNEICLRWFYRNGLYPELLEIVRVLGKIGQTCAEMSEKEFSQINYQKLEILNFKKEK